MSITNRPFLRGFGAVAPAILLTAGCGATQSVIDAASDALATPTTTTVAAADPTIPVTATDLHLMTCLDRSTSMDPAIIASAQATMIRLVSDWTAATTSPDGSRPGRAALRVDVRLIGADSFDPAAAFAAVELHRFDGVAAFDAAASSENMLAIAEAIRSHDEVRLANVTAAEQFGAAMFTQIPLADATEIHGCVSAAAGLLEPGRRQVLLLVSDLEQYGDPQVMGNLGGAEVLVVHQCDDAATCVQLQANWSAAFAAQGAGPVTYVRPETLPESVLTYIGDGS